MRLKFNVKLKASMLVILSAAFSVAAVADSTTNLESLMRRFPQGVPLRINITNQNTEKVTAIEILITSQPATSCPTSFGRGYFASFLSRPEVIEGLVPGSLWPLGDYAVAAVTGDTIVIDFTGGKCDDHIFVRGTLNSDGTSSGEASTEHMPFPVDFGTYHAELIQ
jgi:hypothetical protein